MVQTPLWPLLPNVKLSLTHTDRQHHEYTAAVTTRNLDSSGSARYVTVSTVVIYPANVKGKL